MAWLKVSNFKKQLEAYRNRTGKTNAQVAEDLGTTPGNLKFWKAGTRQPYIVNLQRMAEVFECSVIEFVDDPGQEIAGQTAAGLTDRRRLLASQMFEAITSRDLTDEDVQLVYEDFLNSLNRIRALKVRMQS